MRPGVGQLDAVRGARPFRVGRAFSLNRIGSVGIPLDSPADSARIDAGDSPDGDSDPRRTGRSRLGPRPEHDRTSSWRTMKFASAPSEARGTPAPDR